MSNLIKQGTPHTLTEAIEDGLESAGLSHTPEQSETIRLRIKDFLAQKFQYAMIENGEQFEIALRTLFVKTVQKHTPAIAGDGLDTSFDTSKDGK